MKLTLPVYGRFCCGNDVAMSIQLLGDDESNGFVVVKCDEREQVWGDNGIYSTFGLMEFDTNDLFVSKSNVLQNSAPCIEYDKIKFSRKTAEEMRDWFYKHYEAFDNTEGK